MLDNTESIIGKEVSCALHANKTGQPGEIRFVLLCGATDDGNEQQMEVRSRRVYGNCSAEVTGEIVTII